MLQCCYAAVLLYSCLLLLLLLSFDGVAVGRVLVLILCRCCFIVLLLVLLYCCWCRYGTALGVIRSLHLMGRLGHVYCTETRPYNQGARLTAWVSPLPACRVHPLTPPPAPCFLWGACH